MLPIRLVAVLAAIAGLGAYAFALPKLPTSGTGRPLVDSVGDPLPERAIARLGTSRFRHPGPLQVVAVSRDGKLVAAASALPSVVRIWDRTSGRLLDQWWFVDQSPPEELVFSPDGARLYAGRLSERERLWSAWDVRRRIGSDVGPAGERSVPFQTLAPDGRHALYAVAEKIICWDLQTDRQVEAFARPERQVADCAFVREIGWVAVCYDGAKYMVTRLSDGKQLWAVEGSWDGNLPNQPVAFANAAPRVAIRTEAGRIKVFETSSGKKLKEIKGVEDGTILSMRFSPDDATLAVSWKWKGVRLYDVGDGRERVRLSASCGSPLSLAFAPDSKSLATVDPDGARAILFFETARGTPVDRVPGHTMPISSVAISPDGNLVATAVSPGGEPLLSVWNVDEGKIVWSINDGQTSGLAFSPDGLVLAGLVRTTKNPVRLWEPRTGRVSRDIDCGGEAKGSLAFDCKGGLVTGLGRSVHAWDIQTGRGVGKRFDLPHGVDRVVVTPDLRQVIATTPAAFACDLESGKWAGPVVPFKKTLVGFALSPDGRLLATADGGNFVNLWEVLTWHEAAAIEFRNAVTGVAFSPRGHTLAVATSGGTVLQFLPTASVRATLFSGHSADTLVAYSANGRRLVTAGNPESTATVWDVSDLPGHPAAGTKNTAALDCASCWLDLMNSDPKLGYAAAWKMIAAPDRAVPFLRKELTRAIPDAKQIARLIGNLDSPRFAVREQATRDLLVAGEAAVGALREARKGKLSAEQAERIGELLKKLDGGTVPPDRMRLSRALAVLEQIGNEEARTVLEELARGPDNATLTQEAKAALGRWPQR